MFRMSNYPDGNSAASSPQARMAATGLRHLSQLELARRWSISPRTLERWRWTGDGPRYIKLKGRVAYREADVEAYEAERLMESTQQPVRAKLVTS
jgi:predicted DNA-binding transcriptional regulator AlpA